MKKIFINGCGYLFVVIIGLCIVQENALADYGDMDPGTCEPSGIINKTKEKIDPKGFWAKMFSDSLKAIDSLSGNFPSEKCTVDNQIGSVEYQRCMMVMQNTLNYWVRCNRYAQTICRQKGGYC
jgi:hypothetical protein